jgi:hypothetical protein
MIAGCQFTVRHGPGPFVTDELPLTTGSTTGVGLDVSRDRTAARRRGLLLGVLGGGVLSLDCLSLAGLLAVRGAVGLSKWAAVRVGFFQSLFRIRARRRVSSPQKIANNAISHHSMKITLWSGAKILATGKGTAIPTDIRRKITP